MHCIPGVAIAVVEALPTCNVSKAMEVKRKTLSTLLLGFNIAQSYFIIVSDKVKPKQIQRLVKSEAHRWKLLGFQMKVPQSQLDIIQAEGGRMSPAESFNSVIVWWLHECEGEKYWNVSCDYPQFCLMS